MNKRPKMLQNMLFAAGISLVWAFPNVAFGQKATDESSPLNPLYICAKLVDNAARLKCYDDAVGKIAQSEEKSEIVAIDAVKMKTLKKEAFGFNLPSIPKILMPKLAQSKERAQEEDQQTLVALRLGRKAGLSTIHMENGQVWQFLEESEIDLYSKAPWKVTIHAAALGSYILTFEGYRKGYRVKRVE